jgi:hypothetical protein
MGMLTASIAPGPALPLQGELLMINQDTILRYNASMALFKRCFKEGVIDLADLESMSMILAKKYGLPSNSIFLENDLQFRRKCVMYSTVKGGRYE